MFSELNQTCTATAPGSEKHCTMMAKTAPYPPCTGTVIWLAYRRVPGQLPDAASGHAYLLYCRAVIGNRETDLYEVYNFLNFNILVTLIIKLYQELLPLSLVNSRLRQRIVTTRYIPM